MQTQVDATPKRTPLDLYLSIPKDAPLVGLDGELLDVEWPLSARQLLHRCTLERTLDAFWAHTYAWAALSVLHKHAPALLQEFHRRREHVNKLRADGQDVVYPLVARWRSDAPASRLQSPTD